jgi:hypothetical protein
MKITELSKAPELIKLVIDDKETLETYGEPLEFYTYDRAPLDTFLKLSNSLEKNQAECIKILKTLILTEEGKPVVSGKEELPIKVMVQAMAKIMDKLGNS